MAAGVLAPSLIQGSRLGFSPSLELDLGVRVGLLPEAPDSGAITKAGALDIRSRAKTGSAAGSFMVDYYNRIHLLPTYLDMGSVASEVTRQVNIWNAWLGPTVVETVTLYDDTGLEMTGVIVPQTIAALALLTVNVIAPEVGAAVIDSSYVFDFDRPDVATLLVTGQRARVWPFPPNWRESVEITSSYKTDMFVSRSGREQRRALRAKPRRRLSLPFLGSEGGLRVFQRAMAKWQNQPVVVGDPVRWAELTTGIPEASDELLLVSTPDWLVAGANLILQHDDRTRTINVLSVSGTSVTLSAGVGEAWPAATRVRPGLTGLLSSEIAAAARTSRVVEGNLDFDLTPGSEVEPVREPGMFHHAGREVMVARPNWGESLNAQYLWPVEQVDFGHGLIRTFRPIEIGSTIRRATFVTQGAAELAAIESLFDRMYGRRGEFHCPTHMEDMVMRGPAAEGTSFLRVEGTETHDAYTDDPVHQHIAVRLLDGRWLFRAVTNLFLVNDGLGDDTIVEIAEPWLFDIEPGQVAAVSWMPVVRFASDDLTVEWITESVGQTQLAMQTLEALAAEDPIAAYDGAASWFLEVWAAEGMTAIDGLDLLVNSRFAEVLT